jgi:hypothetical protein
MHHRHLNTQTWSAAAIDSILERGDLGDWQELFVAVQSNREVADLVLRVASAHDMGGASVLARALVERLNPLHSVKLPMHPPS